MVVFCSGGRNFPPGVVAISDALSFLEKNGSKIMVLLSSFLFISLRNLAIRMSCEKWSVAEFT